jgi:hypothetical protein
MIRKDGKSYAERARTRMPLPLVVKSLSAAPRLERAYAAGILLWDNWIGGRRLCRGAERVAAWARELLEGEEPDVARAAQLLRQCGVPEAVAQERVLPKWRKRLGREAKSGERRAESGEQRGGERGSRGVGV